MREIFNSERIASKLPTMRQSLNYSQFPTSLDRTWNVETKSSRTALRDRSHNARFGCVSMKPCALPN